MYKIGVPNRIKQIVSLYYFIGLWQGDNVSDTRKSITKILFLVVYVQYPASVVVEAYNSENEKMFLAGLSITTFLLAVRMYYILWKKDEFVNFIRKLGVHSIRDSEQFSQINNEINILIKFVTFLALSIAFGIFAMAITNLPIFWKDRRLPLNVYLPFDWKHNDFYYWFGYLFVIYQLVSTLVVTLMSSIVWYLMMSCAIQYQTLSTDFKYFGFFSGKKNMISVGESNHLFHADPISDLIVLIKSHQNLQETTAHMKTCFENLFFMQIATSALSICISVYSLAFNSIENPIFLMIYAICILYNFFDIFVVTHLGNEIKFASSNVSYSLFSSNWIDMSETCKKSISILMEVLKRPQELVVGKIYPLDLTIFTRILKLAYSMFNILRNLQFH